MAYWKEKYLSFPKALCGLYLPGHFDLCWLVKFRPMTRSMAGCPLARVNHALAMNEEEIENHFDEIHDELQAYKKAT